MDCRWIVAVCVAFGLSCQASADPPASSVAECKSRDVWDAGYALSFDMPSYQPGGEPPTIMVRIYQIVPLWRKELVYRDKMAQLPVMGNGQCEFELVDQIEGPTTRISFHGDFVRLDELRGTRPERFDELECDPRLLQLLATYCGSR